MKTTILASVLSLVSILSFADTSETNAAESVTLEAAVAASGWTVEELIAALNTLEAKYNRDVATSEGRSAWHGKKVREIIDTNTLTKVSVYADGMTFTDPAKIKKATDAESVKAALAKLPRPVMTNCVPTRLARARIRQRDNTGTVSNVTVTVSTGQ